MRQVRLKYLLTSKNHKQVNVYIVTWGAPCLVGHQKKNLEGLFRDWTEFTKAQTMPKWEILTYEYFFSRILTADIFTLVRLTIYLDG